MYRVLRVALAALTVTLLAPSLAHAAPYLATTERLGDKRSVVIGSRAYMTSSQAGDFPAMGWHIRGEMGGIWSPPIKLVDGVWFGIDDAWVGPATRFESGYGHVRMTLPGRPGLTITRTDFVPDGRRGVLIGMSLRASTAGEQRFTLKVDAHSELMSIYPWNETQPLRQQEFNLQDEVTYRDGALVFTERGTPPGENVEPHDWAAAVGTALTPARAETGDGFRGPVTEPVICPATGATTLTRCDDSAVGKGRGGRLEYRLTIPAGRTRNVWLGVAGSEAGAVGARAELARLLDNPGAALRGKIAARERLAGYTKLTLPGDPRLAESIDWSKQNLADSVQDVRDLEIRETNAGKRYPAPEGRLARIRFLGAGWPDYPWAFATDGEYTAFASVGVGQFEPIKDHLRAFRDASRIDNGDSGKVVHEIITDGSIYFGSNADPGNTDETAKFPSAVALIWRWTGDNGFRDEMYEFAKANMDYIFRELDDDRDGWPEGLGNVEREGMGPEKLDNTVYTIRGLYDLADMAASRGDGATRALSLTRARDLERRFDPTWWMPEVGQHADSLGENNERIQQRHWIGVTPMEVELTKNGRTVPGLTSYERGQIGLTLREQPCYGDDRGMFHTGAPGCDPAQSTRPAERTSFTLNTSIIAVGEGNYGRTGPGRQQRWTDDLRQAQFEDEMPGAMPEIVPSPDFRPNPDKPFFDRAMVLQAWGAYGTVWSVVHQHLGIRPDLGRRRLEVVPQVPAGQASVAGRDIRLGGGRVAVSARRSGDLWRTTVELDARVRRLWLGHTLPRDARVRSVRLDGEVTPFRTRRTNRGLEVTVPVDAAGGGRHGLTIRTR